VPQKIAPLSIVGWQGRLVDLVLGISKAKVGGARTNMP
jgi:hypothetical protein